MLPYRPFTFPRSCCSVSSALCSLGPLGTGFVLVAANFKADQILTHFLDLRQASPGWRMLLRLVLTLLGTTIFATYVLTPMLNPASR